MRAAVAALVVVLGCTAVLAQDLSTNFKVRVSECGWLQHGHLFCIVQAASTFVSAVTCAGRHAELSATSSP